MSSPSEPPLVSIVVNNYNYASYLAQAIESALGQTYPHTEVVVVDDGSTDGSWEIVASYGDRVRALRKVNGGQASAFNAGFEMSRGEIVWFVDSDDARFCPHDSEELMPYGLYAARARRDAEGAGERTKICPTCGDRYPLTTHFCGKDGSELAVVN